jgi:hypothetical protein
MPPVGDEEALLPKTTMRLVECQWHHDETQVAARLLSRLPEKPSRREDALRLAELFLRTQPDPLTRRSAEWLLGELPSGQGAALAVIACMRDAAVTDEPSV